jgi:hypothetical protein
MDTACFQGEQIAAHGFADGLELTAVVRRPRQGGEVDDAQQAFSLEEFGQRILGRTHGQKRSDGPRQRQQSLRSNACGKKFLNLIYKYLIIRYIRCE